jgi:hypothetical protein
MASGAGDELWPEFLQYGMVVLDFDKTITNKHTRGAIFQASLAEEAELVKNFADLAFFKTVRCVHACVPACMSHAGRAPQIIPIMKSHAHVCIATFADDEEEALVSGKALVRKYLDVAFPNSQTIIPGAPMPLLHFDCAQ